MNLVLFDLDNTLLTGDSDFAWAQFLIGKGVLDREVQEAKNIEFYEQYKAGTLDIFAFLDFQLAPLARHPRAQLDAWHREFMDLSVRPMISDKARALVRQHLDDDAMVARFLEQNAARVALDAADAPTYLVRTPHEITVAQERWPDLRFSVLRERGGARFTLHDHHA